MPAPQLPAKDKPARDAPAGSAARSAALSLLRSVLENQRQLDETWSAELAPGRPLQRLSPRDRAFARLLVTTVLRRLGQIDAALKQCLDRPLNHGAKPARMPLRLMAAQLLFLDTPPHAAVDGAVRQLRRLGRLSGLVNAVGRRLAREGAEILAGQDAVRLNCPNWLWQAWSTAYGEAAVRDMVAAMLEEPALHLSVRAVPEDWAEALQAEILPTGTLARGGGGRVEELPGYGDGDWWVQDAAAALPARLLGDVAGQRVLDLCAAPGGKTAQLAAAGGRVTAIDVSTGRLRRVEENLARLHLEAELIEADATQWRPSEAVPAILLDAPCSSTGTIRRHPDVWRLKAPGDVSHMAEIQDRLLDAAAAMLAPGGRLVYCTCSLQVEEGPERIAALLARNPDLARDPVTAEELPGLPQALTAEGDVRTLPHHLGGIDGFYIARLTRP